MPRTDQNGRQLKVLLNYLSDSGIETQQIYEALGISSSTYYRRVKDDDYPSAEELRQVADRFDLSYPDLQVRFGLMSREEVESYAESVPLPPATAPLADSRPAAMLSQLRQRTDAPPL